MRFDQRRLMELSGIEMDSNDKLLTEGVEEEETIEEAEECLEAEEPVEEPVEEGDETLEEQRLRTAIRKEIKSVLEALAKSEEQGHLTGKWMLNGMNKPVRKNKGSTFGMMRGPGFK